MGMGMTSTSTIVTISGSVAANTAIAVPATVQTAFWIKDATSRAYTGGAETAAIVTRPTTAGKTAYITDFYLSWHTDMSSGGAGVKANLYIDSVLFATIPLRYDAGGGMLNCGMLSPTTPWVCPAGKVCEIKLVTSNSATMSFMCGFGGVEQ